MKQYIDKDVLIVEIEKLISNGKLQCQQSQEYNDQESYIAWSENVATCEKILSFLDTLEVKDEILDEKGKTDLMRKCVHKAYERGHATGVLQTTNKMKHNTKEVKDVETWHLQEKDDIYDNVHKIKEFLIGMAGAACCDAKTKKTIETNILAFIDSLQEEPISIVYVVTRCEEHDDYVEKVFFDENKAQKYCDKFKGNENEYARHITKIEITF